MDPTCDVYIQLYSEMLAQVDAVPANEISEFCESVKGVVEEMDASGEKRSYENVVAPGPDSAPPLDVGSCEGGQLAELNDLFFNQLYVDVCGGDPSAGDPLSVAGDAGDAGDGGGGGDAGDGGGGGGSPWMLIAGGMVVLLVLFFVVLRFQKK